MADQFAWVSPFNYAENMAPGAIDLWGLQAVVEADGSINSYKVQEGQGPTQIAKDLQENYGLSISWEDIVDDPENQQYFRHIENERYDPNNSVYRELNMNVGDVLHIPNKEQDVSVSPLPKLERISMANSSDQEIINHLFKAFAYLHDEFERTGNWTPLNLEEYFYDFPELQGPHVDPVGGIRGIHVEIELPVRYYNRKSMNWGSPSQQNYVENAAGVYNAVFVYSKIPGKNYYVWQIVFPQTESNEELMRKLLKGEWFY